MEQVQVKISEVLEMLSNGKTRQEIKEHYNFTNGQLKQVFQHPLLKGKKTKNVEVAIELIDDVTAPVVTEMQTEEEFSIPQVVDSQEV